MGGSVPNYEIRVGGHKGGWGHWGAPGPILAILAKNPTFGPLVKYARKKEMGYPRKTT